MKKMFLSIVLCFTVSFWGCTQEVKMPESEKADFQVVKKHDMVAALYVSDDLKENTKQVTSPFDTLSFPVGPRMVDSFKKNLPQAFAAVVDAPEKKVPDGADILIVPAILEFENHIPFPAYNPHHCKMVCKVTCYDKNNAVIFSQTTTGNAQTGGNLFSGFKSQQLAAEAARLATEDAVKQAIEGLMEAEELKPLK